MEFVTTSQLVKLACFFIFLIEPTLNSSIVTIDAIGTQTGLSMRLSRVRVSIA